MKCFLLIFDAKLAVLENGTGNGIISTAFVSFSTFSYFFTFKPSHSNVAKVSWPNKPEWGIYLIKIILKSSTLGLGRSTFSLKCFSRCANNEWDVHLCWLHTYDQNF